MHAIAQGAHRRETTIPAIRPAGPMYPIRTIDRRNGQQRRTEEHDRRAQIPSSAAKTETSTARPSERRTPAAPNDKKLDRQRPTWQLRARASASLRRRGEQQRRQRHDGQNPRKSPEHGLTTCLENLHCPIGIVILKAAETSGRAGVPTLPPQRLKNGGIHDEDCRITLADGSGRLVRFVDQRTGGDESRRSDLRTSDGPPGHRCGGAAAFVAAGGRRPGFASNRLPHPRRLVGRSLGKERRRSVG